MTPADRARLAQAVADEAAARGGWRSVRPTWNGPRTSGNQHTGPVEPSPPSPPEPSEPPAPTVRYRGETWTVVTDGPLMTLRAPDGTERLVARGLVEAIPDHERGGT